MTPIDLRSDTVTRPTRAMREAMASAEVGDDVYGEDPTVRQLEERVAALLGMERALFVSSGTMGNQLAILLHTRPGDEVIVGEGAHSANFESGAGAALGGVQFAVAGSGGLFGAEALEAAIRPEAYYLPRSRLVMLENTHNRAGGRIFPQVQVREVADAARRRGLLLHLDGARLWNAAAATGLEPAELARPFDTVNVCFSKGLGAPVGSALAGPAPLILEARRLRKMLGGGMRQAGILAAGALHALTHHRERLTDDHRAARDFASVVASAAGARVDEAAVETNIVNVVLETASASAVIEAARERGVLVSSIAPRALRAVTHLDVSLDEVRAGAERLADAIQAVSAR
ncbi:MAG: aminotransferase class I/II-fold pyridoxal phosphate-dependent enzyme [Sorangiineae bacterium]|nr:aminotransferase class I/II-fold pyridoxal phosphate-dependent enzyme [Polyangiaceae bacterium]MEB2321602.1 aminotransferase class I/II-fold pyridoxal phosphate-dependent enzyme [Sorangiineae bacterium]